MPAKHLLIIGFSLLSTLIFAQRYTIKGIVIDQQNSLPVEFASLSILKKNDSKILAGNVTPKNGFFEISVPENGAFYLKIVAIGFEIKVIDFSISENATQIDLGNITLDISRKLLDEVVVSGKKNPISNTLDKQTYFAKQFEAAKGGSAVDVLKNLPSVAVNSSGEISVRGSTGFLVLINGKAVLTDAQTILSQLPANTIENIELITAPSAKYDADGKGGIINITTKKGITDGISIQSNAQSGLPSTTTYNNLENPIRFGGDITVDVKKNKWTAAISANYTRNDTNGQRDGDVFTKNLTNNTITRFPSNGERSFDRYNYGARTAIAYSPTDRDVFNVGVFASKKYQQRRADLVYNNTTSDLNSDALINEFNYFNSNVQEKQGRFILGSFDYTHTFLNASKIIATAIYEFADLFGNTINKNIDLPTKTNIFQLVSNPYTNPINGYRIKLDYSLPIGTGKLETGFQYRNDNQNGEFGYNVSPITNQQDIAKFSGTAKSSNQVTSLYTQFGDKTGKLQYTTGLRYEYATREVIVSTLPNANTLNLSNMFPSINLRYSFNDFWDAKAGYSKRIQRNNNFELNPIPEREHAETLEQGDPNLLPQFIDLIEIGVNHNFTEGSFFATLYYQQIKNPIQRVNSVYSDIILNRIFTNADIAKLIGLELGSSYKPTKWLSTYIGANVYNYSISSKLSIVGATDTTINSNWVYSINTNASFDLGKSWNLQTNLNYLSARPTAQGEDSRFFNPNTSVKKVFKNGKVTVGLQWQNMNLGFLNANQQRITTWGADFYTTTNYIYETDIFLLNISFNLNKMSNKNKLPSSELVEKEY